MEFYFPGPDARYNGTLIEINSDEILDYINAYLENWDHYKELLKKRKNLGREFQTRGVLNMNIRISEWNQGVCIDSYHMPIKNKSKLISLLKSLMWAKEKGDALTKGINKES